MTWLPWKPPRPEDARASPFFFYWWSPWRQSKILYCALGEPKMRRHGMHAVNRFAPFPVRAICPIGSDVALALPHMSSLPSRNTIYKQDRKVGSAHKYKFGKIPKKPESSKTPFSQHVESCPLSLHQK